MKALVLKSYNASDPLAEMEFQNDRKLPQITKPTQVMIKVLYASINPADHMYAQGIYKNAPYKPMPQLPCPLGTDGCGIVHQVGSAVKKFTSGQFVFGIHADITHGTFADYAIFEEAELAVFSSTLSPKEAAAIPLVYTTAAKMFTYWNNSYAEQIPTSSVLGTVIVNGASGGIGSWCVILCKYYYKAKKIIAICSGKNADYVKSLGADTVLDYKTEKIESLASEGQIDLVLDCVGSNHEPLYHLLNSHSCFVTIVPTGLESTDAGAGAFLKFVANLGWNKIKSFVGDYPAFHFCGATPDGKVLEHLVKWLESDTQALAAFKNVQIQELPFEKTKEGIELVLSKRAVGKLVVKVQ